MSRFRRIEIIEPYHPPSFFIRNTSIFVPKTLAAFPSFAEDDELDFSTYALDFLNPNPNPNPNPFEIFDTITDLTQIQTTPFCTSYKRTIQQRVGRYGLGTESCLQSVCDRVSALELSYDRLVKEKLKKLDRKYTWTAEIKNGVDRKYTWTTEIKGEKNKKKKEKKKKEEEEEEEEKKKKGKGVAKNYKWTAEIKGKSEKGVPILKTYTFKASTGDAGEGSGSEKEKKKCKKGKKGEDDTRTVEIQEDEVDHGALVLRQAFAKRDNKKGKKKELSPQDAAIMIQMSFKAYLIRRSQSLRALRELAIAKTKLKEIRAWFHNFSYRHPVARDAEERQRFSEKIIVLLLTVDSIEGADLMVRTAKKSMVDELEAMLEVVDPQPALKSLSMKRRTFDMPSGDIQKELAAGVAQVVQMLGQEDGTDSSTFEACL